MNLIDYLTIFLGLGSLQFLISIWVKTRIEASVKHSYDKKLLEHQTLLARREKASQLAHALARWIKYRGAETKWLNEKELIEYYEELTRLSFELTLVLEDENLLIEVMKKFQYPDTGKPIEELVFELRKILQNVPDVNFTAKNIIFWPADVSFIKGGPKI